MCKFIVSMITAISICFISVLMASTPDGETPYEESVCDELNGFGPLHGLCVAYCEAQDCDDVNADKKSCDKILSNFERKKGKYGWVDSMPCKSPSAICPCFTEQDISNGINAAVTGCGGAPLTTFAVVVNKTDDFGTSVSVGLDWGSAIFGISVIGVGLDNLTIPQCVAPIVSCGSGGVTIAQQVTTMAESEACNSLIRSLGQ